MAQQADIIVRGVAYGGQVKVVAIRSSALCRELVEAHDAGPIGALALTRVATATLLLSAQLKGRQQVGIQVNGDGPIGEIYAVSTAGGVVRATVANPKVELPLTAKGAVPLSKAIGLGKFCVIKKMDQDAPAYRGLIPIVYGDFARDVAEYLHSSEQRAATIALADRLSPTGVVAAGGFLIEALPGADPEVLKTIEKRVAALGSLSQMLVDDVSMAEVLSGLVDDLEILGELTPAFRCTCERERFARVLVGLGETALREMAAEQEITEIECNFCRTNYCFDQAQISALLLGAKMHDEKLARMTAEYQAAQRAELEGKDPAEG